MTRAGRVVARLLRERGVGRHALFLTQDEGWRLPGGVAAISGYVLGADGRVHGFWLDWDAVGQRFRLEPFWLVDDPADLADLRADAEYAAARARLGRSAAI